MNFRVGVSRFFLRILLIGAVVLLCGHTISCYNCSPSLGDIECECTARTAVCSGVQNDILEAEEILTNFSSLEDVVLKIHDLQFDTSFTFENASIKNLTLRYDLQIPSPAFFSGLSSSLISLNLQNNSIKNIDDDVFSSLSFLTELFLDVNELQELRTNTFLNLHSLKHLSIASNNISQIKPEIFQDLASLHTLVLSHNKIPSLGNANVSSKSLVVLEIDNCPMEGMLQKDTFKDAPGLRMLDMSYNKISGVKSDCLSFLKNLEHLNVSHNAIEYLDENAFSEVGNLTSLDLSRNRISVIKITSFSKLKNLKYLDLSGNKLKAFLCEYTTDFTSLEQIYLHNNEIKGFTQGAFFYSPELKVLDIANNSLECSCQLTDSALFLVENSTMVSEDLEPITCIIPSTGSQLSIINYKSSKCIPMEACKKPEMIEEDEDYYDDDDENLTTPTTSLPTENSSEISTVMVSTTTESTTLTSVTASETVNTTLEESTLPVNSTFVTTDIVTVLNDTVASTTPTPTESTSVSEDIVTTLTSTSTETETYTYTTETSESTTYNLTTIPKSSTVFVTTEVSKKVSSASMPDCSSLHLSLDPTSSHSNITIFKNFSRGNSSFCLKWTAAGFEGIKIKCAIQFTAKNSHDKVTHVPCPSTPYEVKEWSFNATILRYYIVIYPKSMKSIKSGDVFTFKTTTPLITVTEISSQPSETEATTQTTTYSTTPSTESPADTTTETTFFRSTAKTTKVTSEHSSEVTPMVKPTYFSLKTIDVYLNDSKLAFATWTVNMQQPYPECNLTLKVYTQHFEDIENVFPCKNNSYRLKKVKESDTFKVCIFSHHKTIGQHNLCAHTLPSSRATKSKEDSLNNSMIPLICLLVLFVIIIIFMVCKNIRKKNTVSKTYKVRAEEEKYQERVKLRPQSSQEENVRFSYIAKENHEYI